MVNFDIVIKAGLETVKEITGRRTLDEDLLTLREMEQIQDVANFLEKLTGYRFHINMRRLS